MIKKIILVGALLFILTGCSQSDDKIFYAITGNQKYNLTKIHYGLRNDKYIVVDAVLDGENKTYTYDTVSKELLVNESWEKFKDENMEFIDKQGVVSFIDENSNKIWSVDLISQRYVKDGELYNLKIITPNVYGVFELYTSSGITYLIDVNSRIVSRIPFKDFISLKCTNNSSAVMIITKDFDVWFYDLVTNEYKNAKTTIKSNDIVDYLQWNPMDKYFYYYEEYKGLMIYDHNSSSWQLKAGIDSPVNNKYKWIGNDEVIYVMYKNAETFFRNGVRDYYVVLYNIKEGTKKEILLNEGVDVDNYVINNYNDTIYYNERHTGNCFSKKFKFK